LLVEKLLDFKVNYEALTSMNDSALHLAVQSGNVNTVKVLLPLISHKSYSKTGTIFSYCKNNADMMVFLLTNTVWNAIPKLVILLDLEIDAEIIVKYCYSEFKGDYLYPVQLYDRHDLIYALYSKRITTLEQLKRINCRYQKCTVAVEFLKKWVKKYSVIFLYKYCKNSCISRLPLGIFREFVRFF
jgi:hypothetical protein